MEPMAIELTCTLDALVAEGRVETLAEEDIRDSLRNIRDKMQEAEIDIKAMKAESEAVAANTYLTM